MKLKPLEWYVDEKLITERYIRENASWNLETKGERCEPFDRYNSMMRSFGEMVRGEKQKPWNYNYEL